MARNVAGLFPDRDSAERAIIDLKQAGFDASRIGVVMRDKNEARDLAADQGARSTEGAVAGGIIGGSLGAILVAVGALAIPGVGPFISGGVLASLVGGTAGWFVGGLAGLGIPKDEAEYYESQVQQGRALVTVDAQGRDAEARSIMLRDGAEDLQDRGFGGGYDDSGMTASTPGGATATNTTQTTGYQTQPNYQTGTTDAGTYERDVTIPVREEDLVAEKRRQEQGRVHVHKDVIEEQETVNVPVQHEEVRVERVPFSGTADTTATDDAFVERDIDMPLMGEDVVVGKRVEGVEEVRIRKDTVTENRQVSDTVRKERVVVDGVEDDDTTNYSDTTQPSRRSAKGSLENAADNVKGAAEDVGTDIRSRGRSVTDR